MKDSWSVNRGPSIQSESFKIGGPQKSVQRSEEEEKEKKKKKLCGVVRSEALHEQTPSSFTIKGPVIGLVSRFTAPAKL